MEQHDSSPLRFNPAYVSFGRHETFPLRYGWITKGMQGLMPGDPLFEAEDATVRLGVGKNMVSSIRFWLQAARLIYREGAEWRFTDVGDQVFGDEGYDPYLEDEATIWLLHWLIASNSAIATGWWWFFNRFHKPEFTSEEVGTALRDFVKAELSVRHSVSTLRSDASVLVRMYAQSGMGSRAPAEEALDSPLAELGLVARVPGVKRYESRPARRTGLPSLVLGYAVLEFLGAVGQQQVPIDELMYGRPALPAIGGLFRLTESDLLAHLERLASLLPGVFSLRETAGVHQLYVHERLAPTDLLSEHYEAGSREVAA